MATASVYLRNEIRKHIFRTNSFTKPTTLYVALLTGVSTEVTGGSYARASVAVGDATWTGTSDGETSNASDITFTTASADWGMITHVGLYDAASGGNQLFIMQLSASISVLNGDTAKFVAGALQFSVG